MDIKDTPYILVRHFDKDYPHCHLVYSRINNFGETISDSNDYSRNKDACRSLTEEYGLHISEGKQHTNVDNLRGVEKIRYEIFNAVNDVWEDRSICDFDKFKAKLRASGVGIEYKYKRGANEVQGLWYTRKGKRFPASKIDRRFSYGMRKHLLENRPLHPDSKWMYADGSIVPITNFRGVKFSGQQINDYVAGKAIRVDGCKGEYPTVYLKFVPEVKVPKVFSSNPDEPKQTSTSSFAHLLAILRNRPLPKMDAVQYPEAIPKHSPSSKQDIRSLRPSKPSMHGEPNAEVSTSTAASTCDNNPNSMPSAAPVVAGGICTFINLIL